MGQTPRSMEIKQQQLAEERGEPDFNLLAFVIAAVNEGGASLADVSTAVGVNRDTLERWMGECGYNYRLEKRFVPIVPVQPGQATT